MAELQQLDSSVSCTHPSHCGSSEGGSVGSGFSPTG